MVVRRSHEQLAEAARLYYLDGLTQSQVAVAIDTTRSNVSRMLEAARDEGIVRISVEHPLARRRDVEHRLVTAFGLHEAVVLAPSAGDTVGRLGQLGARWLAGQLRDGLRVAVSWGRTLQALVEHVEPTRSHTVDVVQLGGDLDLDPRLCGHELVRQFAARLGATYSYIHAPAIVDGPGTVDALAGSDEIARQLQRARAADLALVGVGAFDHGSSAALLDRAALSRAERRRFDAADPAGELCARFYDDEGREIDSPLRRRVLGVGLEDLRRIPRVAAVACGRHKARAVAGALRGGLVDVLICDAPAAAEAGRAGAGRARQGPPAARGPRT